MQSVVRLATLSCSTPPEAPLENGEGYFAPLDACFSSNSNAPCGFPVSNPMVSVGHIGARGAQHFRASRNILVNGQRGSIVVQIQPFWCQCEL